MHTEEEYLAAVKEVAELKGELSRARRNYEAVTTFMSRTSHEIRTPMNSIIGLARLGEEESEGRAAKEYFKKIRESAEYQLEILGEVLDMARIESGQFKLYPEAYSLEALAENLTSIMAPQAEQKGIEFAAEFHDIFADTLVLDKLRLRQILLNLLSNAVKFTPEKGRVVLTVSQMAAGNGKVRTVFTVKDNGIGMSEEFTKNMFKPFTQERTAATAEIQGSGLGLSIVKNLVDMMGGDIRVRSQVGVGTEFVVEIDCEPASGGKANDNNSEMSYDFSGKRALVVDDHSINRILEVKLLKRVGFETDSAANGYECLKKFMASGIGYYDVILMDVKMPVMDGLEAAGKIRVLERSDSSTVKMIAMSANSYPEDMERSKAAGMDRHIAKPVIPAVLYTELVKLLK
ncbi:ATP-binding response regulator [Ruminococcus albus]|uniref:Circadian input-output histidine kinase CikA n=1 Tax=Ruminococcus albus TaxID=1264 RepID=A0A1H7JL75_RUMAL|nr:ATP-binding protein [Ruminococcus albus]SEK75174.1 Signal transduction histidine kinase [Ruminococcus albus]